MSYTKSYTGNQLGKVKIYETMRPRTQVLSK